MKTTRHISIENILIPLGTFLFLFIYPFIGGEYVPYIIGFYITYHEWPKIFEGPIMIDTILLGAWLCGIIVLIVLNWRQYKKDRMFIWAIIIPIAIFIALYLFNSSMLLMWGGFMLGFIF